MRLILKPLGQKIQTARYSESAGGDCMNEVIPIRLSGGRRASACVDWFLLSLLSTLPLWLLLLPLLIQINFSCLVTLVTHYIYKGTLWQLQVAESVLLLNARCLATNQRENCGSFICYGCVKSVRFKLIAVQLQTHYSTSENTLQCSYKPFLVQLQTHYSVTINPYSTTTNHLQCNYKSITVQLQIHYSATTSSHTQRLIKINQWYISCLHWCN